MDLLLKATISRTILETKGQLFHPSLHVAEGTKRMAQLQLHSEIGREPAAGFRKINKRKRGKENDEDGNGLTLIQDVRRELRGFFKKIS